MKNKIFAILLLFIWITRNLFPFLYFELERYQCRYNFSELKNNIDNESIQTIAFSNKTGIHWEKENQEFLLNKQLYDVISIEKTDSLTIIRCVPDSKETKIIHAYFKKFKETEKSKKRRSLKTKLRVLKCCPPNFAPLPFHELNRTIFVNKQAINYARIFMDIDHPPPENSKHFNSIT